MAGFYGGLLEGFNGARQAKYAENQKADADARAQESKLYEYLLQSSDPEIRAHALTGLFESARPGSRAQGLRGFMGEVQGSEMFPQIRALMDQEVPDEPGAAGASGAGVGSSAPAGPATAGSGALPATSAVTGGPAQSFINPTGTPQTTPGGFVSPRAAAGAGTGIAAGADLLGQAPPQAPAGLPAPAPEHPTHRRGTGVPTAEEIAANSERAKLQTHIDVITHALRLAGADDETVQRAISGIAGAPLPLDRGAAGPVMADPVDPKTPIPTMRINGTVVRADNGGPVEGLVGWVKPAAAGGGMTQYIPDTPETRRQLNQTQASPTGYWHVKQSADGTLQVMPGEYTPAPAYGGTTVIADPNAPTGRSVAGVNRGGGVTGPLATAPAPEGQATPDEAEAKGWLTAVDKQVKEGQLPGLGQQKGSLDQTTKQVSQGKYQTYAELSKAAQKSGAPGMAGGGGSVADRVRARIEADRRGTASSSEAPQMPQAPARATGPGPVR